MKREVNREIMKQKGISRKLFEYELKSTVSNGFTFFFGILFPIFMSILIVKGGMKDVPEELRRDAVTGVVVAMSLMCSMATLFMGYGAGYSQELEKQVPLRLHLFGFTDRQLIMAKLAANYVFLTLGLAVYALTMALVFSGDIYMPSLKGLAAVGIAYYILSAFLLLLSHGICNFIRKFGPAYGIIMGLYFIFMAVSGLMGVRTESMPFWLQRMSKMLPMYYFSTDEMVDLWRGYGDYQPAALIQSLLFFGAVSVLVLLTSNYYRSGREG